MSKLRKRKRSEEFEDYIPSEGDSDHEVDGNNEVFLLVRVWFFVYVYDMSRLTMFLK